MRVLIGTPIHISKDYCMEQWLRNVAELQKQTPADLLMVDNSPGLDYIGKLKGYCEKYSIKNYKIEYLDVDQKKNYHEKVARAREVIRREIISRDYDAWFSWECDQIIPTDALDKLVKMMESGNFMILCHNNWVKQLPTVVNFDLGVSLIKRECLLKYSFILEFGTDPDMPHNWKFGDPWLKIQVLRNGGSVAEVEGILNPVYHLDNTSPGTPLPEQAYWDKEE